MVNWDTLREKSLRESEQRKIASLTKQKESINKRKELLIKKAGELEAIRYDIEKKIDNITSGAVERFRTKCKHLDIAGPYSCSRDDCSGSHYSCRDCGTTEFSVKFSKK